MQPAMLVLVACTLGSMVTFLPLCCVCRKQKFGGSQQEPLVVKEKERPDIKGGVLAYVQAVQLVLQVSRLIRE